MSASFRLVVFMSSVFPPHPRMRAVPTLVLLVVAAMPLALATWHSPGDTAGEPNSAYDDPNHMFFSTTTSPTSARVYFHAFLAPAGASANVNGLLSPLGLGTQQPAGKFFAWLGEWRDCNDDGYIGDGATAQETYPASQANPAICAAPDPHIVGTTAKEFRWIGPTSTDIADAGARAWVDLGTAGAPPGSPPRTSPDEQLVYNNGATGARWQGTQTFTIAPGPSSPAYSTAYANVTWSVVAAQGLELPGGPYDSAYGAEACTTFTTGIYGGWNCDPAAWPGPVKVGDVYELRDVDCYGSPSAPC